MINQTINQMCNFTSLEPVKKYWILTKLPFTKIPINHPLLFKDIPFLNIQGLNLGAIECKYLNILRFFLEIEASPQITVVGIKIWVLVVLVIVIIMYILFKPRRKK